MKAIQQQQVNFVWVLICGFLVMSMQAGFALLEAGLTRAKNAANIMMKNMMDFCIGSLGYWAVGFALMMGTGDRDHGPHHRLKRVFPVGGCIRCLHNRDVVLADGLLCHRGNLSFRARWQKGPSSARTVLRA